MLGYVDALRLAGVRTVLFLVSARVTAPTRHFHEPTGGLSASYPPRTAIALSIVI